eukprot:768392-Hanusia_phi.AAC.12
MSTTHPHNNRTPPFRVYPEEDTLTPLCTLQTTGGTDNLKTILSLRQQELQGEGGRGWGRLIILPGWWGGVPLDEMQRFRDPTPLMNA